MVEPKDIVVTAYGEPVTIYEGTRRSDQHYEDECDVCGQDKQTLEISEVHTYNHVEICLDCLISVLPT